MLAMVSCSFSRSSPARLTSLENCVVSWFIFWISWSLCCLILTVKWFFKAAFIFLGLLGGVLTLGSKTSFNSRSSCWGLSLSTSSRQVRGLKLASVPYVCVPVSTINTSGIKCVPGTYVNGQATVDLESRIGPIWNGATEPGSGRVSCSRSECCVVVQIH